MIWNPFKCKVCPQLHQEVYKWKTKAGEHWLRSNVQEKTAKLKWISLQEQMPPVNTNLLVATPDFEFFAFLYFEDGWDNMRKINMHRRDHVLAAYTNAGTVGWWLSLDAIPKNTPTPDEQGK